jgi:hypothetical protein
MADSAEAALTAIQTEESLAPTDEAVLSAGKRTDGQDGGVLILLFAASPISHMVFERMSRIAVGLSGSTVMDWKVMPHALLGLTFLNLLEKMARNARQSRQMDIPSFFRRASREMATTVEENAPVCGECGTLVVRQGMIYKCLNCGARERF